MKKIDIRPILILFFMFLSFFALAFYMNFYARSLINVVAYGFTQMRYYTLWLGFSLSWCFVWLIILMLINPKKRKIVYPILLIGWNILFFAQICYVQQLGKFMIFSDLFVAGEGLHYIKSIFTNINIGMVVTMVLSFSFMIIALMLNKKHELKKFRINKKIIVIALALILSTRLVSYIYLGHLAKINSWQENYNAKSIYVNFSSPNAAMFISGFYEYNIRAVYKYFYDLVTMDKASLRHNVDEYNRIYGIETKENAYTGLLKDKNVIYVMMESIDSWIIDDETMPTLKMMQETGWNFTNRYSPFFNGGQTINSEFALNTGLYAISEKETIYDKDDIDYSYSLANMLKKENYIVNSFHANTGTFYNRQKFHQRMGYMNHYAMLDLQKAGILDKNKNYFSDSTLISDDIIFNLMTGNERFMSFITTYSAHLEYTKDNKVYKSINHVLKHKYKTEEEYIYRTLAHDTDEFLRILIEKLTQHNILKDTIIVLVTDHYVYGYSDPDYVALKKGVFNDQKELQNTPFIIWGPDLSHQEINTILDTADILPTLLNLLGIDYDANKYIGTDVFSEAHDDFVFFSDGTYIAGATSSLSNEAILTKINYAIRKNKSILLTNYYGK